MQIKVIQENNKVTKVKKEVKIQNKNFSDVLNDKILKQEDSFFVCDVSSVYDQHIRWKENLPNFTPFYAIKCNPDPVVLKLLKNLGANYDCASKGEIKTILNLGVDPNRIIFANPCKPISHIKYASSVGVNHMTFDNMDELHKIKNYHKDPKVVIRILADDSKSVCRFGVKFGAHLDRVEKLISEVKELDLDLVGVSFHVGSGCYDASAYDDAIKRTKYVFDIAKVYGYNLKIIDIGGGFPSILSSIQSASSEKSITFEAIASVVNKAIDTYFPNWRLDGLQFMGEPGRYYVSGAYTLATCITSRREIIEEDTKSYMYYTNDGVYGSFNCLIYDHAIVYPKLLKQNLDSEMYETSIWGPTCDSIDLIVKSMELPELQVGDWIYFNDMGAYTVCAASEFNGFKRSKIFYTDSSADAFVTSLISN